MDNPLTWEERAGLAKLIGHDAGNRVLDLVFMAKGLRHPSEEYAEYSGQHILETIKAFTGLSMSERCYFTEIQPEQLEGIIQRNIFLLEEMGARAKADNSVTDSIVSSGSLLNTIIYNAGKNAVQHNRIKPVITIGLKEYSGDVANPLYINEERNRKGDFLLLEVKDDGAGFQNEIPLDKYLEKGLSTKPGGGGFGLYAIKLICKYLRAHIEIMSEPGENSIRIYHPTDLTPVKFS
jgi:signal transduction histidine kinase